MKSVKGRRGENCEGRWWRERRAGGRCGRDRRDGVKTREARDHRGVKRFFLGGEDKNHHRFFSYKSASKVESWLEVLFYFRFPRVARFAR